MFLDHIIMSFILGLIGVTLFVINFFSQRYFNFSLPLIFGAVIFLIYFNKDFFRGKSIAKRLIGLQVFDRKTNQPASRWKCFIRNLTCVLWPLEVIITLFSPNRRLGDLLADTEVRESDQEPIESIIQDWKRRNVAWIIKNNWTVDINQKSFGPEECVGCRLLTHSWHLGRGIFH